MRNQVCHLKFFEEQLYDSVHLIYLAENHSDFGANKFNYYYYHTLCRSSVLSTMLLFESAANCCIDSININDKFTSEQIKEIDRYDILSKFKFILKEINPNQVMNKGCSEVQKIRELQQVRNNYVHPKVNKSEWVKNYDDTWSADFGETQYLKIPNQMHKWTTKHAISALKAANDFFNLFFLELCELDSNTVCGLLLENKQVTIPFDAYVGVDFIRMLDKASLEYDLDFKFIGKKS